MAAITGIVTGVPIDGSAPAVIQFSPAFTSGTTPNLQYSIYDNTGQAVGIALSSKITSLSNLGANIVVTGGIPGAGVTVTILWEASGTNTMPAAGSQWMLQDYENFLLLAIREMDALNFGGVPNFGNQFNKILLDQSINQSIADVIMLAGFQPRLADRISYNNALSTAMDIPIPTDCVGLQRVEYQQAPTIQGVISSGAFGPGTVTVAYNPLTNPAAVIEPGTALILDTAASGVQENVQVTAVSIYPINTMTFVCLYAHGANCVFASGPITPYRLQQLTPDEFDAVAGTGYWPTTVIQLGLPTAFREPIANTIRAYPAIGAQQVVNGDTLNFYYTSYGTTLVNETDVANLPVSFQRAVILAAAEELWPIKGDMLQSKRCGDKLKIIANEMRKFRWNLPQAGTFGFLDEDLNILDPYSYLQW